MAPAEERFKNVVRYLVQEGVYPSPKAIRLEISDDGYRSRQLHNLNGRECRWRVEVLEELGWVHVTAGSPFLIKSRLYTTTRDCKRSWIPADGWEERT